MHFSPVPSEFVFSANSLKANYVNDFIMMHSHSFKYFLFPSPYTFTVVLSLHLYSTYNYMHINPLARIPFDHNPIRRPRIPDLSDKCTTCWMLLEPTSASTLPPLPALPLSGASLARGWEQRSAVATYSNCSRLFLCESPSLLFWCFSV